MEKLNEGIINLVVIDMSIIIIISLVIYNLSLEKEFDNCDKYKFD